MNQKSDRLSVSCRMASVEDTQPVLDLTSRIWDGEDYVPEVWDSWIHDDEGALFIADYKSTVLGLVKLTHIPGGDWWLEGMRVHPEYEGRGIASQLHECIFDYWIQNGNGIIRLATASFRQGIQHLSQKKSFEKIGELSIYTISQDKTESSIFGAERLIPATENEAGKILELLTTSESMSYSLGMLDIGWKWNPPTLHLISESIRNKKVFWSHQDEQVILFRDEIGSSSKNKNVIQALAAPSNAVGEMMTKASVWTYQNGYEVLEWVCDPVIEKNPGYTESGFTRGWDDTIFLYQRNHPGSK